jgi:hypothetical protein
MWPGCGRARDGAAAMFKQRTVTWGNDRNREAFGLLRLERFGFEERDYLIQNRIIASCADVVRSNEGEPQEIIGDSRSDAGPRLRMPPVLHIAFNELPRGSAEDVLASQVRRSVHESHDIL